MSYAHGYRSPSTLSKLAVAGVAGVGLCETLSGLVGIAQVLSPEARMESMEDSLWLMVQGLIALIQFPVYIFAVVTFLMWLHRIYTNLEPLGSDQNAYTPGWAVGWWFLPFANLVKPYQVVKNAWIESDPEMQADSFLAGTGSMAPGWIGLWWGAWIAANIGANIQSIAMQSNSSRDVEAGGYVFIATGMVWLIAALLAIRIILSITERQEARLVNFGARGPQGPPPPPSFEADA
jgi:hypothetical protein